MTSNLKFTHNLGRAPWLCASPFAMLLCGCQHAPTISIAGSFFPVWILSVVLGIVFAAVARLIFIRLGMEDAIKPALLIYPCLAVSVALTLWLVFFR